VRASFGALPDAQRKPDTRGVSIGTNDAFANVAIVVAGFVTALTTSAWPDLVVGLGILTINADAARKVWHTARQEHATAAAS